jgi:phosphoribosylaminoimidazole-succinocarboxamide synthase
LSLPLVYTGKVRDVYDAGDGNLLMVASDRISAFDWVFSEPVADKGRVLTAMTVFWAEELADVAPTHLVTANPGDFPPESKGIENAAGRAILVRRAEMLPIECIVRGYLAGSAWKEYSQSGTVHGSRLPEGLVESQRLPSPEFTPSTKAAEGHDENISFAAACDLAGKEAVERASEICIAAYLRAAERARASGIIVADTKFELGHIDGELSICDEILTPDSSRLWAADAHQPGRTPPSFDKQPVRDWVESTGWDKASSPPPLPDDIIAATRGRYVEAYERITGRSLADWWGAS